MGEVRSKGIIHLKAGENLNLGVRQSLAIRWSLC